MYRREDDAYEAKRRNYRDDDVDKDYRSSRNSKSRWDDGKRHEEGERSRTRWDESSSAISSTNRRRDYESRSNDDRAEGSRSRLIDGNLTNESGRSGSVHARSTSDTSRGRSRSPFRRNDRDYANYSNPPKSDPYSLAESNTNNSTRIQNDSERSRSPAKYSNWSDSSDDERPKNSSYRENTRGYSGSTNSGYGHVDSKEHYYKASANNSNASGLPIRPSMFSAEAENATKSTLGSAAGITLKLGGPPSRPAPLPKVIAVAVPVKSTKVAAVFGDDDDDEPEEMPPECKMRMKNVGRETKTSEGPNSFGKTKIGFCNLSHLTEKELEGNPVGKKKL